MTFQVSGKLWLQSLVMRDLETGSLWSHLLGQAMAGPMQGTKLEILPSVITDWKTWRTKHPDTTVTALKRSANRFMRSAYQTHAERFVLGLAAGDQARAWPLKRLLRKPLIHDTFGKTPVLVYFDGKSGTAGAYDRRIGGKTLTFVLQENELLDEQTKTSWDRFTGEGLKGPLKGKRLVRLPAIISFAEPWKNFHPETTIYP